MGLFTFVEDYVALCRNIYLYLDESKEWDVWEICSKTTRRKNYNKIIMHHILIKQRYRSP